MSATEELQDWGRRLLFSGAGALVISLSKVSVMPLGTAWALVLGMLVVEDWAMERGFPFPSRLMLGISSVAPFLLVLEILFRWISLMADLS